MEENFIFDEILNKINIMGNVLIDIKDGTDDIEMVNELFRAVHTIKGAANMLFIQDVVDIVHKSEDLLQEVRDGKIDLDKNLVHLFFELKDFIKLVITNTFEGFSDDEMVEELKVYFDKKFNAFKSKIILIVTSDKKAWDIEENELKGYTIFIAKNFKTANNTIKHCKIDMLFLDVAMNEAMAIDFFENLKKLDIEYIYLPLVLIVSAKYEKLQEMGKEFGATAWLEKPIDKKRLFLIINRILG